MNYTLGYNFIHNLLKLNTKNECKRNPIPVSDDLFSALGPITDRKSRKNVTIPPFSEEKKL